MPFVGTVPAIKPACASSKTKRVSVLGTKGTVKREYTRKLIDDFAQGCEVTLVGSAELASLAERALSGLYVSDKDIAAELAPCFVGTGRRAARTDTVVLACTHYPLLLDRLTKLAPWPVDWIDPAPAIARRVSDLLGGPRPRSRHRRRRNDLHIEAAAHAEPGLDAVFRRAGAGVAPDGGLAGRMGRAQRNPSPPINLSGPIPTGYKTQQLQCLALKIIFSTQQCDSPSSEIRCVERAARNHLPPKTCFSSNSNRRRSIFLTVGLTIS